MSSYKITLWCCAVTACVERVCIVSFCTLTFETAEVLMKTETQHYYGLPPKTRSDYKQINTVKEKKPHINADVRIHK